MLAWPDTKVRGRFCVKRCGPSRRRVRTASAVLKTFVRQPEKTFSTISARNGRWRKITNHWRATTRPARIALLRRGLSLSYDVVVKQHGGAIEVDTQPRGIYRIQGHFSAPGSHEQNRGRQKRL